MKNNFTNFFFQVAQEYYYMLKTFGLSFDFDESDYAYYTAAKYALVSFFILFFMPIIKMFGGIFKELFKVARCS